MKIDLSGKTALVTGSAGELGRVISMTLAECGADVVLHYMSKKERALEVQKQIKKLRRRVWIVQADLGQPDGVNSMRAQLRKDGISPDILVNNAVSQYPWKPLLKQAPEDYESQFRTCVMQNVLMAQAFAPLMIKKKWGRIIAISTECAMQCLPTQSAYVAGKRGTDGVLRVLAREIGKHGVTVNQVAPGWTISERDRLSGRRRWPAYERNVPLNRRGEDREIAQAVAFLASDLASFITGAWLPVCGGNVMPTI